jgi:hypothetical protein
VGAGLCSAAAGFCAVAAGVCAASLASLAAGELGWLCASAPAATATTNRNANFFIANSGFRAPRNPVTTAPDTLQNWVPDSLR